MGGKYYGYSNRWLSNKTVASVEWGEGGGGNNIVGNNGLAKTPTVTKTPLSWMVVTPQL